MILIILVAAFTFVGLYLISCDKYRVPFIKTSKTAKNLSKRQNTKTGTLEVWGRDLAIWVSKFIKLNEYKRLQFAADLQTAGMNITPELHIAKAIIKAIPLGLLAIPAFLLFPLITPLVMAIAVAYYFKEVKSVEAQIQKKRDAINFELPRLVSTIDKTLEHNRDVLTMLEDYKTALSNSAPELKHELSITVADMRAGNYESALTRLEARVGSSMMSDITRGLIGVLRGDETRLYWSALSVKFADIQRQMLKQQAQKVPGKVRKLSLCLLICFMMIFLVVIGVEVTSKLGILFS